MIEMKIIQINTEKPEQDKIEFALNLLRDGGTVVYPTDTIYGLGVNIYDINAIKKVFNIKKRSFNKPLSICVSQISDINSLFR
jgi:L-threonylcarbamoyladenylate synthase